MENLGWAILDGIRTQVLVDNGTRVNSVMPAYVLPAQPGRASNLRALDEKVLLTDKCTTPGFQSVIAHGPYPEDDDDGELAECHDAGHPTLRTRQISQMGCTS